MLKTYLSQEEIQELNREIPRLPLSLDTFKYKKGEDYLVVSEYLQLSTGTERDNKISFRVDKDGSFVKVFIENDEIFVTLRDAATDKTLKTL